MATNTQARQDGRSRPESTRHTALLERQHELAGQLDALSREQETLISAGEASELVALMARRQLVVDELVSNDAEIAPLRRTTGVLARERDVAALLDAVRTRDESARRALEARKDAIAKELGDVSAARRAAGAYGASIGGPKFQDREA